MVEALAPNRADEPFHEWILPRTLGRCEDFVDAQAVYSVSEGLAIDGVAIAEVVGRRGVVREGVHDLLGRPGCAPLREQPGDGPLGHLDAELHEFAVDSGRAPQGIRLGHSSDEGGDLRVDRRTAHNEAGRSASSSARGSGAAATAGRWRG